MVTEKHYPAPSSAFVTLHGGPTLPVPVLTLAWDLESRGFSVTLVNDELTVTPDTALTSADRDAIRRWRRHLEALVEYCEVVA